MSNLEFYSHEQQDEFVYNLFGQKTNGFFLDISCGNPIIGSNTYMLEKYQNWEGFCFDILDCESTYNWSQKRKSRFIQIDATSSELTYFLMGAISKDTVVDYVSLDVDCAGTNLALTSLNRILQAGVKFKAMTFEHECYIHGPGIRDQARQLLQSYGYITLFSNVRFTEGRISDESGYTFEDWWINPAHFHPSILSASGESLYYFECVEKLKKVIGNSYQATHVCSKAWPNEYRLFWHKNEELQLRDLFSRMQPRA